MLCYQCGSPLDPDAQTCPNCGADLSRISRRIELPQGKTLERFTQQLKAVTRQNVPLFGPGEVVEGRFVLGQMIGSGPYGQVFHAQDRELDEEVALKVLGATWLPTQTAKARFDRTLEGARRMTQKHVVRIHHHGIHKDHPWVAMQHLNGLSLRKLLKIRQSKEEAFELEEVDRIVSGLVAALGHIAKSHPHGDLKPENIIFLPDMLKVTDHVLAQSLGPGALRKAQPQSPYLAPELRAPGASLSRHADLFSLGAIVSEVMFGHPTPPDPDTLKGDAVREAIARLCQSALASDPEARPGSLEAFSEAFATAVDHQELSTTSSLILTAHTLTPPPSPPTLPAAAPPPPPMVEEDLATVELGRHAPAPLPVLGDLLPTNEVDRTRHPLPKAPPPLAHRHKEPTSTVTAPAPVAERPAREDGKTFPLLPILFALALCAIAAALILTDKPREVTLGDEPTASSLPTPEPLATPPIPAPKAEPLNPEMPPEAPGMAQEAGEVVALSVVARAAKDPVDVPTAAPTPSGTKVTEAQPPPRAEATPVVAAAVAQKAVAPDPPEPKAVPGQGKGGCPKSMISLATTPPVCIDRHEYPGAGALPKTKVSWFQAQKACEGQGKRLCTRAEWVRACGGKYPWGGSWDAEKCNTQDADGFERSLAKAGGTTSCRSPSGAYDMVGNVFEWTAEKRIVGGSFSSDDTVASCGYSSGKSPSSSSGEIGFRCCADPS